MPNHNNYINLSYLESITEGDQELIKELISIFIEQMPEFVEGFDNGYSKKDWLKIAAIAHKAKSSVISMGMEELGNNDLKNLELVSKSMRIDFLKSKAELSREQRDEIDKLLKSLEGYPKERLKWVKNNCNEESIRNLIDKFNFICKEAIKELQKVLGN
ncbi:Hpt domain-containing protein [Marinilabiliaceae bacterium JC017]|nr:Hpt domain-containing protein [Marinilabiliaceae bacterium JC017]